jgi:hypothetical protein
VLTPLSTMRLFQNMKSVPEKFTADHVAKEVGVSKEVAQSLLEYYSIPLVFNHGSVTYGVSEAIPGYPAVIMGVPRLEVEGKLSMDAAKDKVSSVCKSPS